MKVRLLGDMTGTRDGVDWPPRGSIVDLPDDEALALCRPGNNMARLITDDELDLEERAVVEEVAVEQRGLTTRSVPGRRGHRESQSA